MEIDGKQETANDAQPPAQAEIQAEEQPRLLVVEDNLMTLRLLERILQADYRVDVAQEVDEALAKAEDGHYDAFILDVNLSERRTGVEVLRAIKRMPHHKGTPILACTAYALREYQDVFLEAGFVDVVTKPVTKRSLLGALEQAFANSAPAAHALSTFDEANDLPPLPTTVLEVNELIASPGTETDFERLITILQRDQVIAAWLIRRVNSAYFRLSGKVNSVERAIQYLGFRPVCGLLLARVLTEKFSGFHDPRSQFVYRYVMETALSAAMVARELAPYVDYPDAESAYSGALMCQLGRLMLLKKLEDEYADLWFDEQGAFIGAPPIGHETLHCSTNYVTLGVQVAHRSDLSDELVAMVRYHRRPDDVPHQKQMLPAFIVGASLAVGEALIGAEALDLRAFSAQMNASYELEQLAALQKKDFYRLKQFLRKRAETIRSFVEAAFSEDEQVHGQSPGVSS